MLERFKNKPTLSDICPMPYGHYKGLPMEEVPASYLMYLYDNNKAFQGVDVYVENNLDVLTKEVANGQG